MIINERIARTIINYKSNFSCDQLITIENPYHGGDVFMGIRNRDGSLAQACGNAARCVGRLLLDEIGRHSVVIETLSGNKIASYGPQETIIVDMGKPRLKWDEIPLLKEFLDTRAIALEVNLPDTSLMHSPAVVNIGNPHAIFFVEDIDAIDLGYIGPELETHPLFPERANISVAQALSPSYLRLKVWERGTGLTFACGTAACAAAVAGARRHLTKRKVTISLPGGDLGIEWRENNNHVYMTGPAMFDFDGEFDARLFS